MGEPTGPVAETGESDTDDPLTLFFLPIARDPTFHHQPDCGHLSMREPWELARATFPEGKTGPLSVCPDCRPPAPRDEPVPDGMTRIVREVIDRLDELDVIDVPAEYDVRWNDG